MPVAPDPLRSRTLRERVGGRWAISWQTYLITAALGLFALLAGEAATLRSLTDIGLWVVLWGAGAVAIGLLLVLAELTVMRHRRTSPVAVPIVVVFDGLCGVVFGLTVSWGAAALALPTSQGLVERTVIDMLTAMWWGPTLSFFFDYRQQLSEVRRDLIAEAVSIELARLQQTELLDVINTELREEIGAELVPARERIEILLEIESASAHADPLGESDWVAVSAMLRGTADDSVRPLSRRLWSQSEERYPTVPWWSLPANILRYQPFRPLAYAMVDIVSTIAPLTAVYGFSRALVLLAAGLVITLPVGITFNALMRRYPHHHTSLFVAMIVVMQASVPVRGALRETWVPGTGGLAWSVSQVLAGIVVVFVTSGFGAWGDKEAELRANLRSDLQSDRIESIARSRQVALVAREAAQVLHGSMQTRLVACSLAIEQAAERGDEQALNIALLEAHDALTSAVPLAHGEALGSVQTEVDRKLALWEGFCDVEVVIGDIDGHEVSATAIGRVVEEGLSNAVRHGKATRITISVDGTSDGSVRVRIDDNGSGPKDGTPGLGSAYLSQVSGGSWSLTTIDGGSRLEVFVRATAPATTR